MLPEPLCMSTELKRKESKMFKSRAELISLVHIKALFEYHFFDHHFSLFKRQSPNGLVHQVIP